MSRHRAPQRSVAAFDSATAMLMALAQALRGRPFAHLGQSRAKVPLVRAGGVLPQAVQRRMYAAVTGAEGVPPSRLGDVDLEQVAAWAAGHYPQRRYPALAIGSSNGALTHLYAACDCPWLPQTWLVPVRRRGADPDDASGALEFGARYGGRLLDANPQVVLRHMHDPNQDALSGSQMAYFRVKWTALPNAYVRFMTDRLEPGAPIIVVRDGSRWPVTPLGERHTFQWGAQGGMAPEEYQRLPGAPPASDTAPEAEWGFEDALLEDVRAHAARLGHPVVELRYDGPQTVAPAVADAYTGWRESQGLASRRLLVSSFIVLDPWQTIDTGSVPFWTYFPVDDAARSLSDYLDRHKADEIDIMLFSHGAESRGLADAATWERLAARGRDRGGLLGVDRDAFPADFVTYVRYSTALRRLPRAPRPSAPLSPELAVELLRHSADLTVLGGPG